MDFESSRYTQETDDKNEIIYRKLRQNFDGKIVRKDLTKAIKEGANVPVLCPGVFAWAVLQF